MSQKTGQLEAQHQQQQQQTECAAMKKLKISEPLTSFPVSVFEHADTLEHLDLSGTGLSSLPPDMGRLKRLRIAFFSGCRFAAFPAQLAACPALEMVAFRANGMREVPEGSLPPRLRWLILTDNEIAALPASIGRCHRLRKCMMAGNRLRGLPVEMSRCRRLALLRLSVNRVQKIPDWLFDMPELAFLSFSGNPCCAAVGNDSGVVNDPAPPSSLPEAGWADIEVQEALGEGASGVISGGLWNTVDQPRRIAVKLFKGDVTSDGTPAEEMQACIRAGSHENLIDTVARIRDHPDRKEGLIMQLVPPSYRILGQPPSLQSCMRDCFAPATTATPSLSATQGLRILQGVASAAAHLHAQGISHGDLYAHNILVNRNNGHALLGDLGAASIYDISNAQQLQLQQLEVLAFAHLIEDVCGLVGDNDRPVMMMMKGKPTFSERLTALHRRCSSPCVSERPTFPEISWELSEMDRHMQSCTQ